MFWCEYLYLTRFPQDLDKFMKGFATFDWLEDNRSSTSPVIIF